MTVKKLVMICIVCLFLVFALNGCTPQYFGGNQTQVGGGGTTDDTPLEVPTAKGDAGSATENSPPATGDGKPDGGSPPKQLNQQDMASLREYLQQIIDDPDSTIKAYLDALSLAKQSGLENYNEFYQLVLEKILAKMSKTLSRPDLCQNDLIRLIEVGRILGMEDDLIDEATSKIGKYMVVKDLVTSANKIFPTVPNDCSFVEYKYDSINKENGNYWTTITASLLGDVVEQTLFDRVNSKARSYNWQRGKIEWNYASESKDSCLLTKKSSIGRADLTKNDGSVSVYSDGTFNGMIISKAIQIEVTEVLQQINPEEDCSGYESKSYTEPGVIQAYIEDRSTDKYKIVVNVDEATEPSETYGYETLFVSGNIHLPFPE